MGPDQAEWLGRLDAELGNLRAAIAVSLTQPDPAPGLRLTASLRVYWMARGHAAEGADALRALLDAPAAEEATLPRAWALAAAARLLQQAGGYAIAGDYCQEALAIARAAGDDYLVADLLQIRAWVLLSLGQNGRRAAAHRVGPAPGPPPWRTPPDRPPAFRPILRLGGRRGALRTRPAMRPSPCGSSARLVTG